MAAEPRFTFHISRFTIPRLQATDNMCGTEGARRRILAPAGFIGQRAARMEVAALRRIRR
jgi:hypothetical protein